MSPSADPRLLDTQHESQQLARPTGERVQLLLLANVTLAIWYFSWLLAPERVGNRALYAVLVAAELFNLVQAVGFWWTCAGERPRRAGVRPTEAVEVDVLIPV